jgi:hypothetical protein
MDSFFIKIRMLRSISRNIHASWRQFTFSLQPNNVFLQFWQMFVSKRIWWTTPGLQLTLSAVEARGNFKGRFSGYIHLYGKGLCTFLYSTLSLSGTPTSIPQLDLLYKYVYFSSLEKKHFFFLQGFNNLYFIFPLSTWDYRKYFILLLKQMSIPSEYNRW